MNTLAHHEAHFYLPPTKCMHVPFFAPLFFFLLGGVFVSRFQPRMAYVLRYTAYYIYTAYSVRGYLLYDPRSPAWVESAVAGSDGSFEGGN